MLEFNYFWLQADGTYWDYQNDRQRESVGIYITLISLIFVSLS